MELTRCVAFLMVEDGRLLVERRFASARLDPGTLAIPGGHVEAGETPEDVLRREMEEELGVAPAAHRFLCTLLHPSTELIAIDYYWVPRWSGTPACREAEAILWLPLSDVAALDFEVDRTAVREYVRLFHKGQAR